jgi:predicted acyltransferase (DUF342 family)
MIYKNIEIMSKWMDLSTNANKIRQSYFKGFIDISGGGVYLRNDLSMNFFDSTNLSQPKFSIKSDSLQIRDSSGIYYAISNEKLLFIKDLTQNVETKINDLTNRTQYITSDGTDVSNVNISKNLIVSGDATFNNDLNTITQDANDNSTLVATTAFVKNQGYAQLNGANFTGDISLNTRLFIGGDASLNRNLFIAGDVSLNGNLNIGGIITSVTQTNSDNSTKVATTAFVKNQGYSTIESPTFTGTATIPTANITNLNIINDASMNGSLIVGKDLTINGRLNVKNYTNQNIINTTTTTYQLIVSEDLSLNGRLVVSGDVSMNGNLSVVGNITCQTQDTNDNSTKISTTEYVRNILDVSLNNYYTKNAADASINSTLGNYYTKTAIDASINTSYYNKVDIDASVNSALTNYYTKTTIDASVNSVLTNYYTKTAIDTSVNSALTNYYTKTVIDASINSALSFKSNIASPIFTGIATIPTANITTLNNSGDASFNGNMVIGGNVTMNNLLDISGSIITHNNVNVYGIINQYTTTLEQGYIVNYNNVSGNGDISANGIKLEKSTQGENSIFGISAGSSLTSGTNNTIVGYNAGSSLTTGINNIIIGSNTTSSTNTVSNEITLGNNSITVLRCQAGSITALSDARDKKNIEELPIGLDFINTLEPVKFHWNTRDGSKVDIPEFGFIAQQLLEAQENSNIIVPNLVNDTVPEKLEASYGALIPIMVKAIKDLTFIVSKQQEEINNLNQRRFE